MYRLCNSHQSRECGWHSHLQTAFQINWLTPRWMPLNNQHVRIGLFYRPHRTWGGRGFLKTHQKRVLKHRTPPWEKLCHLVHVHLISQKWKTFSKPSWDVLSRCADSVDFGNLLVTSAKILEVCPAIVGLIHQQHILDHCSFCRE